MATHTLEELVNKAASILGKLVVGETLGTVEYNTINSYVDDVVDEIDDIVAITNTDEIPGRYFETLARLLAVHAAGEFSNGQIDLVEVKKHEDRLRYLASTEPTFEVVRNEFF